MIAGRHDREPHPEWPRAPHHARDALAHSEAITIDDRASIAWRLGIAAYGLDANAISPLSWFTAANSARVSAKPHSGNIRGGAVA